MFTGGQRTDVRPEDILQFTTGAEYEPELGFVMRPSIDFQEHPHYMPTASTCTNTLYLPLPPTPARWYPPKEEMYARFDNAFTTKQFGRS